MDTRHALEWHAGRPYRCTVSALLFLFAFGTIGAAQRPDRVPESVLWRNAAQIVMPEFPNDALIARMSGVGVSEVIGDAGGRVSMVRVLEAPGQSIEASMTKALYQWRFKQERSPGSSSRFIGKVTFYFVIANGKGAVFSPETAPYVGRWPRRQGGLPANR